ncbi:MAG: DedA family protein [Thermoprotei archaeon]|nr:MAG: DedA family protein [Thermoprotei archaeon]
MSITEFLVEIAVKVVSEISYLGVFILMLLESALIPIPSEAIMPFAGFLVASGEMDFLAAVLAGTLGNLVGSWLAYFLGDRFGRSFLNRYGRYLLITEEHWRHAEEFFQARGKLAVFVGRLLPAIRTVISFPAGMAKVEMIEFSIYTFVGSFLWCLALTYIGVVLGSQWEIIKNYSLYLDILALLILAAALIYIFKKRS